MGIYDRDYYRGSSRSGWLPGGIAPVCKVLIGINIALYVAQLLTAGSGVVTFWLDINPERILHGEIWRLVTGGFLHDPDKLFHILFNMLFLWWFGAVLEDMFGSKEFGAFYLTSQVFSALAYVLFMALVGVSIPAIGASGAVLAVFCVYAMMFPRQTILVMFVIPIEIRWLLLFYVIYDLHPLLLMVGGNGPKSAIAHASHVGGLVFGFLYRHFGWRVSTWWPTFDLRAWRLQREARRRNLHVYEEPESPVRSPLSSRTTRGIEGQSLALLDEEDLQVQVDAILAKVSAQGQASLSPVERAVLEEAGRRFRRKRR